MIWIQCYEHYLWLIIWVSGDQVDSLHQKIIVKVLIYFQQKAQTHLSQSKGSDQSCKVKNEVFILCLFFFSQSPRFRREGSEEQNYYFWALLEGEPTFLSEWVIDFIFEQSEAQQTLFYNLQFHIQLERPTHFRGQRTTSASSYISSVFQFIWGQCRREGLSGEPRQTAHLCSH